MTFGKLKSTNKTRYNLLLSCGWTATEQFIDFCLSSIWTMAIRNVFHIQLLSWMSFFLNFPVRWAFSPSLQLWTKIIWQPKSLFPLKVCKRKKLLCWFGWGSIGCTIGKSSQALERPKQAECHDLTRTLLGHPKNLNGNMYAVIFLFFWCQKIKNLWNYNSTLKVTSFS
jgi:hypothetical protein